MDHIALFTETSRACSKLITQRYSTSFTLGIRTLDSRFHLAVYSVYGFVRWADEIVDTFHGHDKAALFADFRRQTYEALEIGLSLNPVLHAFQDVVRRYGIDREFIEAFLFSMEMDLDDRSYNQSLYEQYIYGSAEVVGLMCLRIFCEGDAALFERLREPARRLGSAFQKVNFLRDIRSDYEERGRVYFPGVQYERFTDEVKRTIEADIRADFEAGYAGIVQLPRAARLGVYLAYVYYLKLFHKIRQLSSASILGERVRVPDNTKLLLLLGSYFRYRLRAI
ncbi:phytoene/squalene synthase family protein [Hymenobacter lutimineralis]|uniref:Phytoene/squalene synthase family protein n=1 Tax=Hymenobacter lutimineralis TaxID=2606448 RepID=A0A5D6UZ33_9BACT|nr:MULTISPECIES: phytoene/squalene synthase family protein [Hymenobacter]QIX62768.1 phytoene/squalene synthase family protein [Hymenobacter sp. BT18]TYZ07624.1 phytoene/squalene synthase family protein [Hymenobacter lutimineralis]